MIFKFGYDVLASQNLKPGGGGNDLKTLRPTISIDMQTPAVGISSAASEWNIPSSASEWSNQQKWPNQGVPTIASGKRAIAIGPQAFCSVDDGTAIGPGARSEVDQQIVCTTDEPYYFDLLLYILLVRPYLQTRERLDFVYAKTGITQETMVNKRLELSESLSRNLDIVIEPYTDPNV